MKDTVMIMQDQTNVSITGPPVLRSTAVVELATKFSALDGVVPANGTSRNFLVTLLLWRELYTQLITKASAKVIGPLTEHIRG